MARKTREELAELMKKENVNRIWSWSRLNCFHNSPFEYYLKYIDKRQEDRQDCIYATTGTITHDILERLYSNQISFENMSEEFEDGWTTAFDIAQLKFDRNDEVRNQNIANKYYADLQHFFKHHKQINFPMQIEQFMCVKIDDNLLHGYIDACYKDSDGNYVILDWKTSTIYKGAKAENECGQLVLYAIALNKKGVPLDKIKIGWDFVKYVSVQYTLKKGDVKTREIERFEIGEKLQSNAKMWLKELGYEDELEDYLNLLKQTNSIECLPEDVQEKYVISDCFVEVPLTQSLIKKWVDYITTTINDIEYREDEYAKTRNIKIFWESEEDVKAQSYYFATLCGYSPSLHLPYQAYLNKLEQDKEDRDNMFSNVGKETIDSCSINQSSINDEDDLSWLDDYPVEPSSDNDEDLSWLDNL